ncbi:hypothetical protein TH61_14910 [Rufibacter sp. DG15C]|uniref:M14 family metallopeptidase n=1 Tax=Rufibacter sp. DG15C TaxID=1379909 RepID=UPI00078E315E|nr:M14 family metallopeptidase [Rufibacter sp. DG15C]AMM52221.1 hypothetical protein TH61_14910 [Rufibacter sp. DG15C]
MISRITGFCLFLSIVFLPLVGWTQRDYNSYEQLTARLKKIGLQYSRLCTVTSIGKTATDKEIWLITLGRENAANKPAIVITAGVHATQLATTELAVQMAEQLLLSATIHDSTAQLLKEKTIYILPNVNPDASEQYHESLRWERTGNAQPRDDDRDGRIFEDPFDDLNGDGLITMIRVKDSLGTHNVSSHDSRVMREADKAKGEKGSYFLYTEGLDNDKDGLFNEDAEGGVNFNKNFSYGFEEFKRETGEHPMSERETKAFADFMLSARNVHSVFVLGPATTLLHALPGSKPEVTTPALLKAVQKDDSTIYKISKLYTSLIPTANAAEVMPTGGDVVQWAHVHYGRFSFSTPAWWVPQITNLPKSTTQLEKQDLSFLEWARLNDMPGVFLDWTPIDHPDFPGKQVEIGGFAPYAKNSPPAHLLKPIAKDHIRFFAQYGKQMPKLQITNFRAERTEDNSTKITADIQNVGKIPSHAALGDYLQWVQKIKVSLQLEEGQQLVQGKSVSRFPSLNGGEKIKMSWVVKGTGYVVVEVKSPTAGNQTKQIALKQ